MMTDGEKTEKLVREFRFNKGTARAYLDFKGRCAYCDEDLMSSSFRYGCGVIDHLLPKSVYRDLEWDTNNWVLCCLTCNSLKRKIDPLGEGENAKEMLNTNKDELIDRVQTLLKPYIEERLKQWNEIRNIVLDC